MGYLGKIMYHLPPVVAHQVKILFRIAARVVLLCQASSQIGALSLLPAITLGMVEKGKKKYSPDIRCCLPMKRSFLRMQADFIETILHERPFFFWKYLKLERRILFLLMKKQLFNSDMVGKFTSLKRQNWLHMQNFTHMQNLTYELIEGFLFLNS